MPVIVPCGKCIGCRLERSRQWAIRCVHEASMQKENSFITLTYNEQFKDKTYSLNKRDYVLFTKKLRKKINKKIRYYHCGEYGEKTFRAHHHACIFGYDFPDKILWSIKNGIKLYRSEELEKTWAMGYCTVGEVTFESAAYVARYIMKKITGDQAEDHYKGREPEYITMSRRPGIGSEWYDKYKNDVYSQDKIIIRNKLICRPPRYYDSKYDLEDQKRMEVIKCNRKIKLKLMAEDQTWERLKTKEEIKSVQLKKLKREMQEV